MGGFVQHQGSVPVASSDEEDEGVLWLLRKERSSPTCAVCCTSLRPATALEASALACDVCCRGVHALEDSEHLLVCMPRESCDDEAADICTYAVCSPCSRRPHSERRA